MTDFRIYCQGWFQVPVVYAWNDLVCRGEAVAASRRRAGAANGH
jgi:hypothetical protein